MQDVQGHFLLLVLCYLCQTWKHWSLPHTHYGHVWSIERVHPVSRGVLPPVGCHRALQSQEEHAVLISFLYYSDGTMDKYAFFIPDWKIKKNLSNYSGINTHNHNCFPSFSLVDQDVRYTAVSSFIFLRFFAPAILSPNLFHLRPHHPVSLICKT